MRRSILIPTLLIAVLASAGVFWTLRDAFGGGLQVSPDFLEFEAVTVGEELQQLVIATNTGRKIVIVDEISTPEGFDVSRGGFQLAPGESAEVVVVFQPRVPGEVAGELRFAHKGREVHSLELSGAVHLPAEIAIAPLAVSFGDVGVGHSSKVELELTNPGGGELVVGAMAAVKPFRVEPTQLTVPPGETRAVVLHFEPEVVDQFKGSLLVRSNDPRRSSFEVQLAGAGVAEAPRPEFEVVPLDVAFGAVSSCSGPSQWVTVRNTGSDALSLSAFQYPEGFLGPSRSRRVAPGREFSFPVTFAPKTSGARSGELRIFTNAPGSEAVAVALSGSGEACSEESLRQIASRRPRRPGAGSEGRQVAGGVGSVDGSGGAGGLGDPALDPSLDPTLLEDVPHIGEDSIVKLLSYEARFSDLNIDGFAYDPLTGDLRIEGIELPPVEAALDEYFSFEPFDLIGRVDALGEFEQPGVLRVRDAYGNTFELVGVYTTGTAAAMAEFGPVTETGVPFGGGEDPVIWFVGACPPGSTCDGQVGKMKIVPTNLETLSSQNLE